MDEALFSPHPWSGRLLVVGSVRRIIGGFDFRKPLHADGVDLGDPVLEADAFDVILYLAIPENAFQGDELPLLEGLGELREIPPGIDAVPLGAIVTRYSNPGPKLMQGKRIVSSLYLYPRTNFSRNFGVHPSDETVEIGTDYH
jgi:hypothetical protein